MKIYVFVFYMLLLQSTKYALVFSRSKLANPKTLSDSIARALDHAEAEAQKRASYVVLLLEMLKKPVLAAQKAIEEGSKYQASFTDSDAIVAARKAAQAAVVLYQNVMVATQTATIDQAVIVAARKAAVRTAIDPDKVAITVEMVGKRVVDQMVADSNQAAIIVVQTAIALASAAAKSSQIEIDPDQAAANPSQIEVDPEAAANPGQEEANPDQVEVNKVAVEAKKAAVVAELLAQALIAVVGAISVVQAEVYANAENAENPDQAKEIAEFRRVAYIAVYYAVLAAVTAQVVVISAQQVRDRDDAAQKTTECAICYLLNLEIHEAAQ